MYNFFLSDLQRYVTVQAMVDFPVKIFYNLCMIKLGILLNAIEQTTLIEIVDINYNRIFYGMVKEFDLFMWKLFNLCSVVALNTTIVDTSDLTQQALIQIIITNS